MLGAPISLGSFTFDDQLFGDSLVESDGGTHRSNNWLNVVSADPGNPAVFTGANFNSGIANMIGSVTYTIHYGTSIVNQTGDDFGIVAARFSPDDFFVEVSTDNGATFSSQQVISAAVGVSTGVPTSYYYVGAGPYSATLFVYALDFALFGVADGAGVNAIRISSEGGDLIRVGGFTALEETAVPEPATFALMGAALGVLALVRSRRSSTAN